MYPNPVTKIPQYITIRKLSRTPSKTGLSLTNSTTSSTRDPAMKPYPVWKKVPILATVLFPITVYAANVTDAAIIKTIPAKVFPLCISHGRINKTALTSPIKNANDFNAVIFSSVKKCAISIVKSGFKQIREAAVAALQRSTPS